MYIYEERELIILHRKEKGAGGYLMRYIHIHSPLRRSANVHPVPLHGRQWTKGCTGNTTITQSLPSRSWLSLLAALITSRTYQYLMFSTSVTYTHTISHQPVGMVKWELKMKRWNGSIYEDADSKREAGEENCKVFTLLGWRLSYLTTEPIQFNTMTTGHHLRWKERGAEEELEDSVHACKI